MHATALGLIAGLLLAGGCENSAPSCEAAVEHLAGLGEVPAPASDQLVRMCKDQNWNADTRRCLAAAEDPAAAQACLKEKR